MIASVKRFVDIDAGHRVARHESKCSNLHGHRYRLTVEVQGQVKDDNSPEHGMVIDFTRVKEALMVVHDMWDHKFLLGADDPMKGVFSGLPGLVLLPVQPTAENLASIALTKLQRLLSPLTVVSVVVQETTSCSAEVRPC